MPNPDHRATMVAVRAFIIVVTALIGPGCQVLFSSEAVPDAALAVDASTDASAPVCVDPMLESWTFSDVHPVTGFEGFLFHPTLTPDSLLIFGEAPGFGKIFQSRLDSNYSPIPALADTEFDNQSPSLTPDGLSMYFARHEGATGAFNSVQRWQRDADGVITPVTFSISPAPSSIEPGTPGQYKGELRMVVSAQYDEGFHLIEMRSSGDDSWIEAPESIPWSDGTDLDREPYLSPDGCLLLFSGRRDESASDIYLAVREASGLFGSPKRLTLGGNDHHGPILSPDGMRYLYTVNGTSQQVLSGTPAQ